VRHDIDPPLHRTDPVRRDLDPLCRHTAPLRRRRASGSLGATSAHRRIPSMRGNHATPTLPPPPLARVTPTTGTGTSPDYHANWDLHPPSPTP
jgi:hypothetical protein